MCTTLLTSTTVSFSSFAFTFHRDGNWVFSDINIASLNFFRIFSSSSFNNLVSFPCQQTATHLSTDTQTSVTSIQFCYSSIATSRSPSPSSLSSFNTSALTSALPAPPPSPPQSLLSQHKLKTYSFQCFALNLCSLISLPPLSIHNRCILPIFPLTFLSLSK